ncbi:MAG: ComF family protein, partial [Betaproteobacteria bacterium]
AIANPTAQICGRCLVQRPHYDRVVVPFSYGFPASVLVQGLKYRGELACARPLASGLVEALEQEPYPDVLLAMPLAPARAVQRGFNQAMEISRLVAAEFGLEVSRDLCRRTKEGSPQATLPWKERARNIRHAFICDADLTGKRVAIVDDVLTTGATLNELALTLKRQGASEVSGWIVARTPAPGDA